MGLFFYGTSRWNVLDRRITAPVVDRVRNFVEEFGSQNGLFLVDLVVRGQPDNLVVEVFIDGDTGVDTAACAEINRRLGKDLDDGVLAGRAYTLTVSSPGTDRPLRFPRQYPKHVGRGIRLTVRSGEGTEQLRGVLEAADISSIRVRTEARTPARECSYDDIVEARIEPRW